MYPLIAFALSVPFLGACVALVAYDVRCQREAVSCSR